MVADAEGATKVAHIRVRGATSDEAAHSAARKVADSMLVQCSLFGEDPYWGRIVSELGSAGTPFDIDRVSVAYGGTVVCAAGEAVPHDAAAVATHMAGRHVEIECDLGLGAGRCRRPRHGPGLRLHRREQDDVVSTPEKLPVPPRVTRAQKAAAENTASVLVEALPYIRRFWGKIVVVKYGGNALHASDGEEGADPLASFAQDVVLMRAVGMLPVVVHGGGPQIGDLMARLGKETEFRNGLRVTDADTLDIARMVLVGKVNRDIVSAINVHGPLAVGMSGEDANLITAAQTHVDLGFVGNVSLVDPTMLQRLVAEGLIPVVATIGADESGQAYNINADTVAGALAEALQAEKLIFLTDIEGLRVVADDPSTVIHQASLDVIDEIVRSGGVKGGMMPKVEACARAVRAGVTRAHILDGRVPARAPARAVHRFGGGDDGAAMTSDGVTGTSEPTSASMLMRTYADPPATFVRGEGTVLFDADGTRYLDFITGLAVVSLGHAHPVVAEAVAEQARTLSHVSNLYGNTLAPEVARTIDRLDQRRDGAGRRPGLLRQLGGGGQRMRAQAGPALGWRRSPRRHQRGQRLSRPHARHLDRDRPAREASALPAAARGLRARALRRRRRARQGARRRDGGRRVARAASRARAGSWCRARTTSVPCARCARSATRCSCSTRSRRVSAGPDTGSPSRRRASSPTW